MMMFFYSAQIHLRKVLNRVHTDLYKVESKFLPLHRKLYTVLVMALINIPKNKARIVGRPTCKRF